MPGQSNNQKPPASVQAAVLQNKTQPASIELERAVLSAMLRDPEYCIPTAVSVFGNTPEVFYTGSHRELFRAIYKLAEKQSEKSVDLVNVAHALRQDGKGDLFDEVALAELYSTVATTANIESWCQSLRDLYMTRKMIGLCNESLIHCYDTSISTSKLLEDFEKQVYELRNTGEGINYQSIKDCVRKEFEYLHAVYENRVEVGISSGYTQMDKLTGGLKPGEMFVLAARPSIGKTAFALNIIRNIAFPHRTPNPKKVVFFSLEMTAEQITRRLLCTEADVSEGDFRVKDRLQSADLNRLAQAVDRIRKAKLYIDPTPGLTVADLRARARRMYMTKDEDNTPMIDMIVIDYLQLMHAAVGATDGRQQEVAAISNGLKAIAKELNVPVLVLAQLNREIDKNARPDAKPKLSHLRESGAIEQDADVVAFLHRNRDEAKDLPRGQSTKAEVIIEKNRNGQIGVVNLLFFPYRTEFCPASPHSEDEMPESAR